MFPSWLKTFSTVCDPKPLFSNWPVQCVFLYVATPAAVMSHMFLSGHAAQMWSDCCCQHSDFHASSILHIKTSLIMRSQSPANVTCFIAAFIWLTVSTRIHFLTSVLWCRVFPAGCELGRPACSLSAAGAACVCLCAGYSLSVVLKTDRSFSL